MRIKGCASLFGILLTVYHMPAAEAGELNVTNVRRSSAHYVEVTISGTTKGIEFSCALLDKSDNALAADTGYTDNLATRVLIAYDQEDFVSAKCVEN